MSVDQKDKTQEKKPMNPILLVFFTLFTLYNCYKIYNSIWGKKEQDTAGPPEKSCTAQILQGT